MPELRSSIFREMILRVRRGIADITEQERYGDPELLTEIKNALNSMPNISGMVSSQRLSFTFRPIDADANLINKNIYENEDNVTTNYHLVQTDNTKLGTIETKAWRVPDLQVALLTFFWNTTGATNPVTLDVSLDKDPDNGETLSGAWLVADSRIDPIANGVQIDVGDIPSPSFSVQWNFPTSSDYKVLDTTVDIMLINSSLLAEHREHVILTTVGNIFTERSAQEASDGNEEYAKFLMEAANSKYEMVRGRIGGGIAPSLGVKSINANIDRTTRANRAFNQKLVNGEWVEIVGTVISGKRIRRTLT